MHALIARLSKGEPLGRNATRRNSAAGVALPSFAGTRVLVADDSAVNREVIIEALSRLQIEPDVVEDGQAAVDAAAAKPYDLVLMDCSMPVMDVSPQPKRYAPARRTVSACRSSLSPPMWPAAPWTPGNAPEWTIA